MWKSSTWGLGITTALAAGGTLAALAIVNQPQPDGGYKVLTACFSVLIMTSLALAVVTYPLWRPKSRPRLDRLFKELKGKPPTA